jgi:hypothetical protein
MTNIVTTRCKVLGPDADVEAFRRHMIVELPDTSPPILDFNFAAIAPVPAGLDDPERGHDDFRKWAEQNWGCWGTYELNIMSGQPLEFRLDTAYLFPEKTFQHLARDFPKLEFACLMFDDGYNMAGRGSFNPVVDETRWTICEPTDALFEQVYGKRPEFVLPEEKTAEVEKVAAEGQVSRLWRLLLGRVR